MFLKSVVAQLGNVKNQNDASHLEEIFSSREFIKPGKLHKTVQEYIPLYESCRPQSSSDCSDIFLG